MDRRRFAVAVTLSVCSLQLTAPMPAHAQGESGNVCVRDYLPGAVCTSNDVRIEALVVVSVVEDCVSGVLGETEVVFQALVSADGSPDRWDVGLFLALDGGSARDGDGCYHDFLSPPLTTTPTYGDANMDTIDDILDGPWWDDDGDSCGDIEANTQVIKTLPALRFACIDNNGDGSADVSACTSWDNNAGTACNDVTGAFPGTAPKCSCDTVELGIAPSPEITLVKSPNTQTVAPGGTALFQFTVTSRTTISNVVLSDPDCDAAPTFTGGDTNNDTILTPDETWTYSCSKTGVMASFTNTATVTGDGPLGDVMDTDSSDVTVSAAAFTLEKSGVFEDESMDGFAQPGETITYTFLVTNTGELTLTDVEVTDPLPGLSAIACTGGNPIPSIDPGNDVTCTATLTLDQDDVDSGQIDNTATATAVAIDFPPLDPVMDSASVSLPSSPSLSLEKTGAFEDESMDGFAQAGETITYTFLVTNTGTVTLAPVSVTDPDVAPIDCTGGNPIPSIAPGDDVTCTGSYTILAGDVTAGQKVNTATATGLPPSGDPVDISDEETTPLPAEPRAPIVSATKTSSFVVATHDNDGNGVLSPGDDLEYTVVITNSGAGDALGVVYTDTPDPDTALIVGSVTTTQGSVVTGNTLGDTSVQVDIGTIAAGGGSVTITYEVTVADPLAGGDELLENQGVASGSNFPDVLTDDPAEPGVDDPTVVTVIVADPEEPGVPIPTLSQWAMMMLVLLLTGAAVRRLAF